MSSLFQHGFSLIEVLTALLLLTVACVMYAHVELSALRITKDAANETRMYHALVQGAEILDSFSDFTKADMSVLDAWKAQVHTAFPRSRPAITTKNGHIQISIQWNDSATAQTLLRHIEWIPF